MDTGKYEDVKRAATPISSSSVDAWFESVWINGHGVCGAVSSFFCQLMEMNRQEVTNRAFDKVSNCGFVFIPCVFQTTWVVCIVDTIGKKLCVIDPHGLLDNPPVLTERLLHFLRARHAGSTWSLETVKYSSLPRLAETSKDCGVYICILAFLIGRKEVGCVFIYIVK